MTKDEASTVQQLIQAGLNKRGISKFTAQQVLFELADQGYEITKGDQS